MTEDQIKEFEEITKPAIKWLCENLHPFAKIIIDCTGAELVEGSIGFQTNEYLVD